MIPGLTTAAAGMSVEELAQQMLANNLANQDTPGFKVSMPEDIESPVQEIYQSSYGGGAKSYVGQMGTGVTFQEGVPNFSSGTMQQTGRSLDVGISDTTLSGTYGTVQGPAGQTSAAGPITVGNQGRLGINGQPLAVLDGNGNVIQGVYAVRNPQYQGTALTGTASAPDYDAAGNPSFLFANAQGQIVGVPGEDTTQGMSIRVGNQADMGDHSFYPVDYVSATGATGIALTKDGALQLDANNTLVDAAGHKILPIGSNGLPIQGGKIVINPNYQGSSLFGPSGQALTDSNGQVSYRVYGPNNNVIPGGRLGTVDVDVTQVSPLGQTEFMVGNSLTAASVMPQLKPGTGQLNPGSLEESNVDPTTIMTQMMNASNMYEANQRMVQTEDQLLQTAVTDVGKVSS
ncbi:flagellar basal body protein [Alicyclobacillus fastidiosus]|uniref:Flagellar basal body protein n=1 Tax=Alicyclobacillus fastidiosus TaxID=392011 RepID=A0ABY6ZFZ4_9BACL|nr:flagellar basal body rod C-terminal domain-containing protein [Alicyclobacillus fastidiosus]WAH41828.1 flagellar basal body protein [Alicyclobacillus fastidiosus]GMA63526.1 flagellar hook protein FlgE [Alicyclobacillus fastidiosus]